MVTNPDSLEHDRYVRTVIRTIASQEYSITGSAIPEDVLMVGVDWIYLAKLKHIDNGPMFSIDPVNKFSLKCQCSLLQIIGDFYSKTPRLSLIPEGDQRIQEARGLSEVIDEQEFSFMVKMDYQDIFVYLIRDARQVVDDNNTTESGLRIGFTGFN